MGDISPQQPEIRRNGHSPADAGSAKTHYKGDAQESGNTGPVPEENQPGHHPEVEQDKPQL